ncbi:MAG: tetratricopeptide repeat protein [Chlorobi bacterium]|nr:tetratricopeptide repeat protein [Chlorobiota bacterium]
MHNKFTFIVLFSLLWLNIIIPLNSFSQPEKLNLSDKNQQLIQDYKEEIKKYKISDNYNQASHYITKVAYIYWNANYFSEAINYFKDAVNCFEKTGNINAKKVIYNNLGMIYSDLENYAQSLEYFKKGLSICKDAGDKKEISLGYNNVAIAYSYLQKYDLALDYAQKALDIAAELNDMHLMLSCYIMLTEYYEKLGNTTKSMEYFNYYSSLQKHIQDEENKVKMMHLEDRTKQAENEKNKKEKELKTTIASLEEAKTISKERMLQINLLNKENEINELEIKEKEALIKNRNNLIKSGILGLIIVLGFTIIVLRLYRQKLKNNKLLEEQNLTLIKQKEKINEQRKELEHTNKKLEKKNIQILDSISYASRIQEAILPYEERIKKHLPDSFIYYKPRDIVSGDFYWFSEKENKIFIAEVDCTGHGVPGAFMSMIGNTLLNEIVNEKNIYKPSKILKELSKGIIFTLNQGSTGDHFQEDGMEMSLCCIDIENNELQIAMANQTAIIIENDKLKHLTGDIYTVGGTFALKQDDEFTNYTINYSNSNTALYMFSDGYIDQFGGIHNKKFLSSQFEELLVENNKLTMNEQAVILDMTLNSWKGNNKQIDDILVIGIKLSASNN